MLFTKEGISVLTPISGNWVCRVILISYVLFPGDGDHRSTPYLTIGVGMFSFDPYAYLEGQKYYLRELGTEGQAAGYDGRKPYNNIAVYIPLGVGYKYNLNPKMNIGVEIVYNFTTTDYLDDVSKTYAGINNFPTLPSGDPSVAALLQDRSYETGTPPIGIQGRQRGYKNQTGRLSVCTDYVFFQSELLSLSFSEIT